MPHTLVAFIVTIPQFMKQLPRLNKQKKKACSEAKFK